MKTALQELIERLEENVYFIADNDAIEDRYFRLGLIEAISIARELLPYERERIEEAYVKGSFTEMPMGYPDAHKYYEKTYGAVNPTVDRKTTH